MYEPTYSSTIDRGDSATNNGEDVRISDVSHNAVNGYLTYMNLEGIESQEQD